MTRSARSSLLLGTAALLVLTGSAPALSASILNGAFDTFVPSNDTGGAWTSSNIDANGGWRSNTTENSFENFFILNQSGQSLTDPTLEQTVLDLVVGQRYTVTGDFEPFRERPILPLRPTFGVEIIDLALNEYKLVTPAIRSFRLNFVATSTSHVLRLTGERNGVDTAYAVDNVSIALPEPGAALLLLGVGAALVGRAWLRDSKPHA